MDQDNSGGIEGAQNVGPLRDHCQAIVRSLGSLEKNLLNFRKVYGKMRICVTKLKGSKI